MVDAKVAWGAIAAAEGSVRLAAAMLGVRPRTILEALADDPRAIITVRRATIAPSTPVDTGPLHLLDLSDDEDEDGERISRWP